MFAGIGMAGAIEYFTSQKRRRPRSYKLLIDMISAKRSLHVASTTRSWILEHRYLLPSVL